MKYTEEKKKLESLGLENRLRKISKDETKKYCMTILLYHWIIYYFLMK